MRLYAVWSRNRTILLLLVFLFIVGQTLFHTDSWNSFTDYSDISQPCLLTAYYGTVRFVSFASPSEVITQSGGCIFTFGNRMAYESLLALLFFETCGYQWKYLRIDTLTSTHRHASSTYFEVYAFQTSQHLTSILMSAKTTGLGRWSQLWSRCYGGMVSKTRGQWTFYTLTTAYRCFLLCKRSQWVTLALMHSLTVILNGKQYWLLSISSCSKLPLWVLGVFVWASTQLIMSQPSLCYFFLMWVQISIVTSLTNMPWMLELKGHCIVSFLTAWYLDSEVQAMDPTFRKSTLQMMTPGTWTNRFLVRMSAPCISQVSPLT